MQPEEVFRRYDIRGEYPEEVDEEFAERLGRALGTFALENFSGRVVVGQDTKDSSSPLKQAFIDGLVSVGIDVLDAGTGPTDYVAFVGRESDAVSVQVTSSHLPLDANGFKFMYPEGNGFLNPDLHEVQDLFRENSFEEGEGSTVYIGGGAKQEYRDRVREYFKRHFDSIDRKVVVDTLGGAATAFLPRLLEELGAEVVDIAREHEERPYVDPPNPKPGNLERLEEIVREEGADMAVATDMDADRVAVYYRGDWLTGDELFALLAQLLELENVVASVDTSRAVEEVVESRGGEVSYTRVGDPFVVDEALDRGAELAGEPNGHYCFPEFVPYNSGTLAALLLAAMEIDPGLEEIPDYHTARENVEVEDSGEKEDRMEKVEQRVKQDYRVISDLDGVKFRSGEGNVLVRSSGSSPVIRVIAEAGSTEEAEKICGEAVELVRNP